MGRLIAASRRAELLVESLFQSAPIGLALFDRDLRYVRVNAWLANLKGRPIGEHIGRTLREMLPALADRIEPLCRRVLEEDVSLVDLEFHAATPARPEEARCFAVRHFPLHDAGTVIGVGVIVEDVTERHQIETEREQRRALELSMGILGHDLRNPLNAILLSASAAAGTTSPESAKTTFERVARSARRMRKMIDQLLDVTRARAGGGIPIDPRPANLQEITAAAIEELEAAYPTHTIVRAFEGDANGCFDPDRMTQVVSNLVANALQHGYPQQPIAVSVRGAGPDVSLTVRNGGRPIPEDALKVIFDPFYRAEAKRDGKGLGLGLFVVREIVIAHGGTVRLSSSEEQGTEITVKLPRRPSANR